MAQPSLDNRLNAAPRPWIRNSQTPPKSELRYSKPSSGNSQTLPKSELRYRKNGLVCSSLTPPPQARQRGRRIYIYIYIYVYIYIYYIHIPGVCLCSCIIYPHPPTVASQGLVGDSKPKSVTIPVVTIATWVEGSIFLKTTGSVVLPHTKKKHCETPALIPPCNILKNLGIY